MNAPPKPHPAWVVAVALMAAPIPLWFVLNYLRPDLVAAMLDHPSGSLVSIAELALTGLGLLVGLLAIFALGEKRGVRIALVVGAWILCTLPALFLVVFGPIVFAFMFGNVDR